MRLFDVVMEPSSVTEASEGSSSFSGINPAIFWTIGALFVLILAIIIVLILRKKK